MEIPENIRTQSIDARKDEETGHAASDISRDFDQQLMALLDHVERCRMMTTDAGAIELLNGIESAARRVELASRKLLDYSALLQDQ